MYSPASLEERGGGKNATTRRRPCFDILVVVRACGKVLDGEILRIPPKVRRAVEDLPRQYRRRSSTEAGRRLTSPISSRGTMGTSCCCRRRGVFLPRGGESGWDETTTVLKSRGIMISIVVSIVANERSSSATRGFRWQRYERAEIREDGGTTPSAGPASVPPLSSRPCYHNKFCRSYHRQERRDRRVGHSAEEASLAMRTTEE